MEKVVALQQEVEKYLDDFSSYLRGDSENTTDLRVIKSEDQTDFILMEIGFREKDWFYRTLIHFYVPSSNEIVLLCNNTEVDLFDELVGRGIDKDIMIVGWIPPDTWQAYKKHRSSS